MTAPEPSSTVVVPEPMEASRLLAAEIDRSCRLPVLLLFTAGALWLLLGALFGVITAIKAHGPGFLASPAWLTYGRVRPFATNAFLYGFVLQTGVGVALWMFSRLGRTRLVGPVIISGAALLWNLALAMGLVLVLAGGSTGYEWLEIPSVATPVLLCAFMVMGAWALINLHLRRERTLYVSQWLLLAAFLWFPWIYATAQVLLVFFPVRGIMQAVVNGWFAHNLFEVCLAGFGLASIFYFIPKILGRPLYSRGLALFGFWFLVLFGGWGGVRLGEPAPNWLGAVSGVARGFLLVPIVAFALSWAGTLRGAKARANGDTALRFILVAAVSYVLAAVLRTLVVLPLLGHVTVFTVYDQGIQQLFIHGFLAMALTGAAYYIAPRVAGSAAAAPGVVQVHFWCALAGVTLSVIGLVVGGLVQGAGINDASKDFLSVMRSIVPFLGINTLGMTLLLVGYAAFGAALVRIISAACPCADLWDGCCKPLFAAQARKAKP